jgi:hypothetical protein
MPRTESGRAVCNSSGWDPANGHSPVSKSDRPDARFINSISKPPRSGKQTTGPATGIARSNLNPGESVFDRNRPAFDLGKFKKSGRGPDYTDYRLPEEDEGHPLMEVPLGKNTGAAVPAVCEGASCGGNVNAKSNAKFGSTSYERLNDAARNPLDLVAATIVGAPHNLVGLFVAEIMESRLFRPQKIKRRDGRTRLRHTLLIRHNGRLLKHIFRAWFGENYPGRWDQAASCYLDIRVDGRATNSADLTWSQAAGRMADEATDNLCTRQYKHYGRRCPLIFYEKPFLCIFLFWLMAGLETPLSKFWHFVAEPPNQEKEPCRYIPSNIYKDKDKRGRLVTLNDLLSVNAPRLGRYYRERWRQVAETIARPIALTDRDKIIASHWPLVVKKCGTVPKADRADAIQACMERLVTVWEGLGSRVRRAIRRVCGSSD